MKVLFAFHPIENAGGIINHNAQLIGGFRDLGWKDSVATFYYQDKVQQTDSFTELRQDKIWAGRRFAYKTDEGMHAALKFLKSFDLIIWSVPVPTKAGKNKGNNRWPELYNTGVPQIAVIHDGNLLHRTPWIHLVRDKFVGFACVHPCAYGQCAEIAVPRALIFNPQDLTKVTRTPFKQREAGFFSAQTYKAWKHVDDLVRAIPYLPTEYKKYMGGGGIEYHYMASKTKCKDKYKDASGTPIWDIALDSGMEWLGYLSNTDRVTYTGKVKCAIDPAWSLKYADTGDMFSRAFVDATMCGTLPIARNMNMGVDGNAVLYKAGVNFIMAPYNAKPRVFAKAIKQACTMSKADYSEMITRNYDILQVFDRTKVAQEFIQLAATMPTGHYHKLEMGVDNPADIGRSNAMLAGFFNILPPKPKGGVMKWMKK